MAARVDDLQRQVRADAALIVLGYTMLDRFRSARDAVRVLEILDAAQQSAREHRRVDLDSLTASVRQMENPEDSGDIG